MMIVTATRAAIGSKLDFSRSPRSWRGGGGGGTFGIAGCGEMGEREAGSGFGSFTTKV
jgi:hypothetical protein